VSALKCSLTPVLDGRAGVDTSSDPVHGWTPCGDNPVNVAPTNMNNGSEGSWGDSRHIHDWTFRTVEVAVSVDVVGTPLLAATGVSTIGPMVAGGLALLLGLTLVGIRRRSEARAAR
jgi:LPXTG-motif cell wall-anchored protein